MSEDPIMEYKGFVIKKGSGFPKLIILELNGKTYEAIDYGTRIKILEELK